MDIKDSDNIKDLYFAQLISAEAYLYCLDNNIKILSDFITLNNQPCNSHITEEIESLIRNNSSENNEHIREEEIVLSIEAYQKYKYEFSNRTQNMLRQLESNLSFPSKEFFDFLLYNPDPLINFKSLNGAGYKTVNELRDFAVLIKEFLETNRERIDIDQQDKVYLPIGECYLKLKQQTSTKAKNILNSLEEIHSYPKESFFTFLKHVDVYKELKSQQGVGAKTIREIEYIFDVLKSPKYIFLSDGPQGDSPEGDSHLDSSEYVAMCIEKGKEKLSIRSLNALDKIYSECPSLKCFCDKILDEGFDFMNIKNVGKKSAHELNEFTQMLKSLLSENKRDENAIAINNIQKAFDVSNDEAQRLHEISIEIGYFPLFAAINMHLKGLGRDWTIIEGRINIFEKQTIKERELVAQELKLTSERVRQLQVKAYESLISTITLWKNNCMIDRSFYDSACSLEYEHSNLKSINECERVNFNHNFIIKVLHTIFSEEYSLLGDETIAFFNPYNKSSNLYLIPQKHSKVYDFQSFRFFITEQVNSKVYETYEIDLNNYLLQFFLHTIDFEALPDISEICKKIIYNDHRLIVNNGILIIEQNATKNIPDILEDILEENNRVMTLDELYNEIEKRHPGMTKDKDALRGSTLRNPNIVPIGRSSKYALKKWSNKGIVGGTIRDIAFKFLDESSLPASLEEVTDHVITFRPKTDTKSVYSNLFADTTTRFKFFTYQGLRHVGLSHKEYPAEYLVFLPEEAAQRRTFKESIEALESFIKTNNRFPFSVSAAIEEERLFRFLNIQKAKKKKGNLNSDESHILTEFERKYGHLEISKNDFLWNQKYDEVIQYVAIHGMMPTRRSDLYLYNWIYNQRRALIEGSLNDEQADKIIELDNNI